jgi:oligopeptide/dipeptide ABC transporter, ATP-binding protein, C-terminal domain
VVSGKATLYSRDGNTIDDVLSIPESEIRRIRYRWGKISIVFQGAMNSLNPLLTVKDHFVDTAQAHGIDKEEALKMAAELLRSVRLEPARVLRSYPHQLSGGMKQRVMIALALMLNPDIIILDEPTTALDTLTQRQILELIKDLRKERDVGIILITHDLSVVADVADKLLVLYKGYVMEIGEIFTVYSRPYSPYTLMLINSFPAIGKKIIRLKPAGVTAKTNNRGCPFIDRCPFASIECSDADMKLVEVEPGHYSSCIKASVLQQQLAKVTTSE